jgi:CheY-like chemotaxis protein
MTESYPIRRLPRILLIDDDAVSLEVFSMLLEINGFPVDSVEGGAKALEFLSRARALPEIILMDTQMPGLSGLELVKALRQSCDARLIAISGSSVSDEIRESTDGFLLKPVEVEALIALLEADDAAAIDERPVLDETPAATFELLSLAASAEDEGDLRAEPGSGSKPEYESVIDPIVFGKLKAMMPASALREVYSAVASDMKTRLPTLAAAMDAGDATEVARIAHTIKGGCAMVGFTVATEAAARLEISNRSETWPKELLQLHFALSRLQGMLGDGLPE